MERLNLAVENELLSCSLGSDSTDLANMARALRTKTAIVSGEIDLLNCTTFIRLNVSHNNDCEVLAFD